MMTEEVDHQLVRAAPLNSDYNGGANKDASMCTVFIKEEFVEANSEMIPNATAPPYLPEYLLVLAKVVSFHELKFERLVISPDNSWVDISCGVCPQRFRRGKGFNIKRHLERKHLDVWRNFLERKLKHMTGSETYLTKPNTNFIPPDINVNRSTAVKKRTRYESTKPAISDIDCAIGMMIALDLPPLRILDDTGFRLLLNTILPNYEIPSKKKIVQEILPLLYHETIKNVTKLLQETQKVTLSTDLITCTKYQNQYATLRAHFIDDDWNMRDVLVGLENINEQQISGVHLQRLVDEYNLQSSLSVTDKGTNIRLTSQQIPLDRHDCFADLLQRVCMKILGNHSKVTRVLTKCRNLITSLKKSLSLRNSYEEIRSQWPETDIPYLKLNHDTPNRWNSTYNMVEQVLNQQGPLNFLFSKVSFAEDCILDDNDWRQLKNLITVLKPFEEAVRLLSDGKYAIASTIIPTISAIRRKLIGLAFMGDEQLDLMEFAQAFFQEMEKHFALIEANVALAIATLLDPRFKCKYFDSSTYKDQAIHKLKEETVKVIQSIEGISEKKEMYFTNKKIKKEDCQSTFSLFDNYNCSDDEEETNRAMSEVELRADTQVNQYLKEPRTKDLLFIPLQYWKVKMNEYPQLAIIAKEYLSIPAIVAPSDQTFCKINEKLMQKRLTLGNKYAEFLLYLNSNLPLFL